MNIGFYDPDRIVIEEIEGVRWFSDSYTLVPLRVVFGAPMTKPGVWFRDDDENSDASYSGGKDSGDILARQLVKVTDRNLDRKQLPLTAWALDAQRACVYLDVGVLLNRLILDVGEHLSDRKVDGFGVRDQQYPVTLYRGTEIVGLQMPVRENGLAPRVDLGIEAA